MRCPREPQAAPSRASGSPLESLRQRGQYEKECESGELAEALDANSHAALESLRQRGQYEKECESGELAEALDANSHAAL